MRRAKSAKTLRHEATNILEEFGVKKPPVPVEKIATSLGARLKYSPFDGELAGMLIRSDEGTVIGVNSLHHMNRQRFTIAHECGHLLLHKGIDVHIDRSFRVNKRDEKSSQAIDPEEIEANRFAAELLMPYDMIVKDLVDYHIDIEDEGQLKELADKYQVSVQALTHRITNVLDDLF
ncbi:ImmA/IrrE family metallo-endopeptidase [Bradyrhizobium sp. 190]|uniref:ImmA/IrrE family metallo-endopeptidase n=1 Tax=unclassified Bradyrhizobium TaxID=2631580 RepID=UPI001FFA499D|nr:MULTISPECIES: ImmA/IrrE family metallo-endopeptidase [unclassified Bradyrhizobium]MCK1515074.1 ImmA/IrrE family metallo-endopeptidase [Bradyrhizobium sp. 190]UPJ47982.1 ImmA/IrrE family metallo-endopeptidase [Bradyrhizobium sp. 200]